jgi:hypothetical protein
LVDVGRELAQSVGRKLEGGPQSTENGKKMQKDTKIEGTNSRIYWEQRT